MNASLSGLKKFRNSIKAVTIEELYEIGLVPEYDEQKECYYFEDPITDQVLTPCISDIRVLERYLNEHPEVLEKLAGLDNGEIEEDMLMAA